MLDQNTDRMWYVIGAVIVGAGIILLANKAMPELFASVADTFSEKTDDVTAITDGIMPIVLVEPTSLFFDDLTTYKSTVVKYDNDTDTWTLDINSRLDEAGSAWYWSRGLIVKDGRVQIPWGGRMTLSYELFVPEGMTDIYVRNEINNRLLDPEVPSWASNDHDDPSIRAASINGVRYEHSDDMPIKDGEWNTVTFSYVNNSSLNEQQLPLYDVTRFGIQNNREEAVRVQIRDVEWTVTEE